MQVDLYELGLACAGISALFAAWIPTVLTRRPLSLPAVLVLFGAVAFALPFGIPAPDPRDHVDLVERLAELAVVVSLMGAGLSIDRPFHWRTWASTWRMLGIAMPVSIALTALAGAFVGGFSALSALLLGAVLAPTDPVLATDVQVGEPTLDEEPVPDAEDEVRFTLTSEGGLNDALAFPFVYAAIRIAEHGWDPSGWFLTWLGWDVLGRIAIGLAVGWVVGKLLGLVAFRVPGNFASLAENRQGYVAVAATLLAYGAGEVAQGYGFVAVFVAAVVLRGAERTHEFHGQLHAFIEQVENLLVVGLLLLLGGALVTTVLDELTWQGAVCAALVVVVIRPVSGHVALLGSPLTPIERNAISFFGIRGFGSVYYLAYALSAAHFTGADELWATVSFTLLVSIVVHGIAATPVMDLVDRGAHRALGGRNPPPESGPDGSAKRPPVSRGPDGGE